MSETGIDDSQTCQKLELRASDEHKMKKKYNLKLTPKIEKKMFFIFIVVSSERFL